MARVRILKWLYKHSPVNFYSITENDETIIKSINNISIGYKFKKVFTPEQIEKLRKDIKWFKRISTIVILLSYIALVYGVIFPNYSFFEGSIYKNLVIVFLVITITILIAIVNSTIFKKYLLKNFGAYEQIHFPSSNSIEEQSYKDFKRELVKIFLLVVFIIGMYFWIGSPYANTLNLIHNKQYEEAIKRTSLWSKIVPNEPKWYSVRGYAKFHTGDYDGALEDYDKAFRLENDEYKMINFDNKIFVLYHQKKYKQALENFDYEIKNAKNHYEKDSFLWDKAQFLYNIEDYKAALKIYNKLLINSESDNIYLIQSRLYYERSLVYQKMGKEAEAQEDRAQIQDFNMIQTFQNPIPQPSLLLEEI